MKRNTVLVVDDVAENLDILVELLEDYDVIDISNSKDALQVVKEENIDLILLDIMMPDMDGYEVCKRLKQNPDTQNIPIIFLTAKIDEASIGKAYDVGGLDYVTKPFKPQELLSRIKTQLDMKKLISNLEKSEEELKSLNDTLERRVEEQVEELKHQYILIAQKSRLASMGEMINIIAHQWRQPLNRINSNVAVISTLLRRKRVEHKMIGSQADKINKNTKYMSDTIEDFSNFFHPDKQERYFLLQDVVSKALALTESYIQNVEINIVSHKSVEISTFEKEYLQVILIILNNAIENFDVNTTQNPRIEIMIKEHDDGMAYLSIGDNGGGIEKKTIDRIFDPYYTTKLTKDGTGLGLYVAKMLIENSMQGKLEVTNKNGGAYFEIMIPRQINPNP